jgi:hypothetical protein
MEWFVKLKKVMKQMDDNLAEYYKHKLEHPELYMFENNNLFP